MALVDSIEALADLVVSMREEARQRMRQQRRSLKNLLDQSGTDTLTVPAAAKKNEKPVTMKAKQPKWVGQHNEARAKLGLGPCKLVSVLPGLGAREASQVEIVIKKASEYPIIVDISQSLAWAPAKCNSCPCFTTSSRPYVIFGPKQHRHLTLEEMFQLMGFPLEHICWPEKVGKDKLRRMIGNSMHVGCVAMALFTALCLCTPDEKPSSASKSSSAGDQAGNPILLSWPQRGAGRSPGTCSLLQLAHPPESKKILEKKRKSMKAEPKSRPAPPKRTLSETYLRPDKSIARSSPGSKPQKKPSAKAKMPKQPDKVPQAAPSLQSEEVSGTTVVPKKRPGGA